MSKLRLYGNIEGLGGITGDYIAYLKISIDGSEREKSVRVPVTVSKKFYEKWHKCVMESQEEGADFLVGVFGDLEVKVLKIS